MCLTGIMELLCMQCSGIGPHLGTRGKSHCFSQIAAGTWGAFSRYGGDVYSKLVFVQRYQVSCLVTSNNTAISLRLGRAIGMLLEVRHWTNCPFLLATVILGFLSIFNKSQASSPFEALNSACLSRCQRDVRPPVQMRRVPGAFSMDAMGDSDIHSSCEIKDETAFKTMQGNPAFFHVSASRCPFHLRQKTQGPSHITIAEGSLLVMCLWKVGLPLQLK